MHELQTDHNDSFYLNYKNEYVNAMREVGGGPSGSSLDSMINFV